MSQEESPGQTESVAPEVGAWTGELPISSPWLREQLPADVMAYLRIPHPLGMMAIPKGNLLDTALGSEANITNLIEIQRGLASLLTEVAGPEANAAARLLTGELRSPVEVTGAAIPAPWLMIGATLDLRSNAELESLLAEISTSIPVPPLLADLDDEGFGQFQLDLPAFVHFDAATGRLALYGGTNVTLDRFRALLTAPGSARPHPMRSLESQIDSSGYGYFAWVDTSLALGMAPLVLPPEMQQLLRSTGTDRLRALAFGAGIADGKGRLKMIADVGTDRSGRPLPVVENRISATAVGDPRSLFLFSLPSADEFTRLESLVLAAAAPSSAAGWSSAKAAIAARIGVSIEDILAAIGPELISFSDRAGDFFGIRVRNARLLDDVLARLADSAGVPIGERSVNGHTIHDVSLSGTIGVPAGAGGGGAAAAIAVLSRVKNRMYWLADGDYLYLSGVPQLLIDRTAFGADTSIAGWARDTQRVDMSSSLFAATGSVANLPRLTYQMYLGMTQNLADLVDVDYDIWAMPTPRQLGLPERGSLGFSVNLGEPLISLELSYESNPMEVLFGGGGLASVAAAGIVAAIAIPAYQDYTIRAQVTEGLNLAAAVKFAVAESFRNTGVVPANRVAAGLPPAATDTQGKYVQGVEVVDGEILIRYGNQAHAQLNGRTVVLTPYQAPDGSIVWRCGAAAPLPMEPLGGVTLDGTSVQPKYLPGACRATAQPGALVPPSGGPFAALF